MQDVLLSQVGGTSIKRLDLSLKKSLSNYYIDSNWI